MYNEWILMGLDEFTENFALGKVNIFVSEVYFIIKALKVVLNMLEFIFIIPILQMADITH